MTAPILTQDLLKKALEYNSSTGVFTRLISSSPTAKPGSVAGSRNKAGYRHIELCQKKYKAHRLAWFYIYGDWPKNHIDHINGEKDDNRIANLRDVTRLENGKNMRKGKRNKSGTIGVHWDSGTKKWRARIYLEGIHKHLGVFKEKADAIAARKAASIKYGFHPNHGN